MCRMIFTKNRGPTIPCMYQFPLPRFGGFRIYWQFKTPVAGARSRNRDRIYRSGVGLIRCVENGSFETRFSNDFIYGFVLLRHCTMGVVNLDPNRGLNLN
jgi:hypothetical protein